MGDGQQKAGLYSKRGWTVRHEWCVLSKGSLQCECFHVRWESVDIDLDKDTATKERSFHVEGTSQLLGL
jgi:hypothetical protein